MITYPVYTVIQKPWQVRQKGRVIRARQAIPEDPYSGMCFVCFFFLRISF